MPRSVYRTSCRIYLGKACLSASFIPVYAGLLAKKDTQSADRVAGAVFAILALLTSVLALIGVVAAPWLIIAIAPGFTGAKRDLTVQLVRILFPGAALLVLSAWCLGILNSHRRFLLSYSAPVIWNAVMIAVLVWFGRYESLNATRRVARMGIGVRKPSPICDSGTACSSFDRLAVH